MQFDVIKGRDYSKEFIFNTSRSSGPGGQNVNKVNSKVELRINIMESQLFSENEKLVLSHRLKNNINLKGELLIISQTERTQLLNKQKCIDKFFFLIQNALTPLKHREKTIPTKASKEKRYEKKLLNSNKKVLRRKPEQLQ
jgi:ribosome-associated protein